MRKSKYGTLADERPDLAKMLDEKKTGKSASEITLKSGINAWWICKDGHSFQRRVFSYLKFKDINNCPYCSNRTTIIASGINDLRTRFPDKAANYSKDNKIPVEKSSSSSLEKFKWECNTGHYWIQSTYKYVNTNFLCPFCEDKRLWIGLNDLETKFANIAKEFDEEKNAILASEVLYKSNKKFWWKCAKNGHEFLQTANKRTIRGYNCPYCSHKTLLIGFNDFATRYPKIAKEWHPIKNETNLPKNFTAGSHVKIWWLCELGHDYKTMINDRVFGYGCPYCSGNKVWSGFNDFATIYPEIIKEWHPTKNNELTPEMITYGSTKIIWWKCKNDHEWKTEARNRSKNGCKKCSKAGTSQKEQDLAIFIKSVVEPFHKVLTNVRNVINPKELDVYIPDLGIAFEFNGVYWHDKSRWENDLKNGTLISPEALKTKLCNDFEIELFHIWEDDWDANRDSVFEDLTKILHNKLA